MSVIPNINTLAFYRRALKTVGQHFKTDARAFNMMKQELKVKTLEFKDLRDEIEIQNKIFFGEEVIDILDQQLMVGLKQESGAYRYTVKREHAIGPRHISEGTQIPK